MAVSYSLSDQIARGPLLCPKMMALPCCVPQVAPLTMARVIANVAQHGNAANAADAAVVVRVLSSLLGHDACT
jgi:hypothetical protein